MEKIILTLINHHFDNIIKVMNEKAKDAIEGECVNKKAQTFTNNYNSNISKDIHNKYSKIIDTFNAFSVNFIDGILIMNKSMREFLELVSNILRKSFNDLNAFEIIGFCYYIY